MICGAYIKSGKNKNCICQVKGKDKYNGLCGNHRDRHANQTPEYECHICMETLKGQKVVFKCGHHMCEGCWIDMRVMSGDTRCPMCRGDGSGFKVQGKDVTRFLESLDCAYSRKQDGINVRIESYETRRMDIVDRLNSGELTMSRDDGDMMVLEYMQERDNLIFERDHCESGMSNIITDYSNAPKHK